MSDSVRIRTKYVRIHTAIGTSKYIYQAIKQQYNPLARDLFVFSVKQTNLYGIYNVRTLS